jgi:uncharacterized protein (DUF302 family)
MSEPTHEERGWIQLPARSPVATIADRLQAALKAAGILVFARIDFCADAARAGLSMRPEQLIVFGNPKAGTPLMVAAPTAGLDLPLKALIWEDADGQSWIAYNDPQYILSRHGLEPRFRENLAAVVPLIEGAVRE